MYTVRANDALIYSPDMVEEGLFITSPTITKEVNKAGSFEFGIYSANPYYNLLQPLKTIITVYDDNTEFWRGRVVNIERGFDNRRTVYCEGTLSFFVDSIIRPHDHTKTMAEQLRYLVEQHNSQVDNFKKFKVAEIDVDDPYGSIQWKSDTYERTKEKIENIVTTYGGYLVAKYENGENTLYYLKDPSKYSTQTIDSSVNLLDLTESINPSNVYTALIPIAYDSKGNKITIVSVNDNLDYITSSEGVEKFGLIFYSHTFSENINTPADLKAKAIEMLEKNLKASRTVAIKAYDLHMVDPSIDKIDIYDKFTVQSTIHDITEYDMCSKVSINLENPENSEYTIGTIPEGITADVSTLQINNYTIIQQTASGGGGSSIPDGDNQQY